jgi:hypothetical protein
MNYRNFLPPLPFQNAKYSLGGYRILRDIHHACLCFRACSGTHVVQLLDRVTPNATCHCVTLGGARYNVEGLVGPSHMATGTRWLGVRTRVRTDMVRISVCADHGVKVAVWSDGLVGMGHEGHN